MQGNVLQEWEYTAQNDSCSVVIPDGCRDLLFRATAGCRPHWQITALDNAVYSVDIKAGDYLKGYRLRPGVSVHAYGLLNAVKSMDAQSDITGQINDFTAHLHCVSEALESVASSPTVSIAAAQLGVNTRKLQRICEKTGRTAVAWLSLARARKAARLLSLGALAETAYGTGYADQAHMCREFKRWFGVTPTQILGRPDIIRQLDGLGYY